MVYLPPESFPHRGYIPVMHDDFFVEVPLRRRQATRIEFDDPPPESTAPTGPVVRDTRYPKHDCVHLNTKNTFIVSPPDVESIIPRNARIPDQLFPLGVEVLIRNEAYFKDWIRCELVKVPFRDDWNHPCPEQGLYALYRAERYVISGSWYYQSMLTSIGIGVSADHIRMLSVSSRGNNRCPSEEEMLELLLQVTTTYSGSAVAVGIIPPRPHTAKDLAADFRARILRTLPETNLEDFQLCDKALSNVTGPNPDWLDSISGFVSLMASILTLNPALAATKIEDLIKHGSKLDILKELSNVILSLKYGILPIPSELTNISKALASFLANRDAMYERCSATSQISEGNWTGNARCSIIYTPSSGQRFKALGVHDILNELWNIIPLSFVVDWFLDVGGKLEMSASAGIYSTFNIREVCVSHKTSLNVDTISTWRWDRMRLTGSCTMYTRKYLNGLPQPNYFQLPEVDIRRHWAEAAALIVQRLK